MTVPSGTDPAPPAGQGVKPDGGERGTEPKMFSEEEVDRKLRGKAAEVERERKAREALEARLAKIEADAKAHAEAALAEQGKWKELAEQRNGVLKERDAQLKEKEEALSALEQREAKRREAIAAQNKERLKALPDEAKKGIPKDLDPEAMAAVLTTIESLVKETQSGGRFGGSPRPPTGGTPERDLETANQQLHDLMMGRTGGR